MDIIALGLASSANSSAVSGWKSVDLDENTGVVTAIDNEGRVKRWQYQQPKDGIGIEQAYIADKEVEGEIKHFLHLIYEDGRDEEVGELPGGGDNTGKVKMDGQSIFNYLGEWIDKKTIVNDNGVLKAKILDGMNITVAEINLLTGVKSNVQAQIDALTKITTNYGIFDTKAALDTASATTPPTENQLGLIRKDETRSDKQTSYIFINGRWVFWTEYTIEIRDFTVNPIDLTTEVTGILPENNISADIARKVEFLDKTTYAGKTAGVVKKAEELDGVSKTEIQSAITEKHTHANKQAIDKIISTGDGSKFLNDKGEYIKVETGGSITLDDTMSDTSENGVKNKVIKAYVDEVRLAKYPNVTVIGNPTVNGGQMSGFSNTSYARFPFLVDFNNRSFEINFDITTGDDVTNQQNLFDSDFGFAFAIRNSRFIMAMSTNGQTWDLGESTGVNAILPNIAYKIKISWDRAIYKVEISTNGGESWMTDITKDSAASLYPTQIYIGVGENHAQVQNFFKGIIDFTNANLIIDGTTKWVGLDVVGLDTRLAVDVSNIDEAGKKKIKEIVGSSTPISQKIGNKITSEPDGMYCPAVTQDELTLIDGNIPTEEQVKEWLEYLYATYVRTEELTEVSPEQIGKTYEITEEHLTNKTYNGKPVYEVTVEGTVPSTSGSSLVDLSQYSIDKVIDHNGIARHTNGDNVPLGYWSATNNYINGYYSETNRAGNFVIVFGGNWANATVRVTMEYTKREQV